MVEISVVIPVYRNAGTLWPLYQRLRVVLDRLERPWEVIFVNDACPEGSAEVLKQIAAADGRVRVFNLGRNVGQGPATWLGLQEASGRFTVVMDADLQDPPEAIPKLLEAMQAAEGQVSVVFAGRRGRYESLSRLATGLVFRAALALICRVPMDAGGFCLMDARARAELLAWRVPRPHIPTLVGCAGLPSKSVAVRRDRRLTGASAYSVWARWRLGLSLLWLAIRLRLHPARYRRMPESFRRGLEESAT